MFDAPSKNCSVQGLIELDHQPFLLSEVAHTSLVQVIDGRVPHGPCRTDGYFVTALGAGDNDLSNSTG
jgi:hypothetical protein